MKSLYLRALARSSCALAVAAALSACGGGGGRSNAILPAPAPTAASGTTIARVMISIPAKSPGGASSANPAYVSAGTQSISIKVDSGTPVVQNLTTGSNNCAVGSPLAALTCTVDIAAQPGNRTITFTTFDQTNATGNQLSVNSVTQTLNANQVNLVNVTLAGIPKAIFVSALSGQTGITGDESSGFDYLFGASHAISINVTDADGYVIVGPGAPVLSVSVTGATSGANMTVSPMGNSNLSDFALNATSAGWATLNVTATPSSTLAGSALTASVPIISTVLVSTIDGNHAGFQDGPACVICAFGPNAYAELDSNPVGMTYDASDGNLYITDTMACSVRRIQLAAPNVGTITSFAGAAPPLATCGYVDGTGIGSAPPYPSFNNPQGIAYDASNQNLYVGDLYNCEIRQVTPAAVVTTVAGMHGSCVWLDGQGAAARFQSPGPIVYDPDDGNLYVGDSCTIRKVTTTGTVTTVAGSSSCGYADGSGLSAAFGGIAGITYDGSDHNLYVTDAGNCSIRRVTTAGVVTTIAGSMPPSGVCGSITDGTGSAASFSRPFGIAYDSNDGTLYMFDGSTLRQVTTSGVVTTNAGFTGRSIYHYNGLGFDAYFNAPQSLTFDPANGMLYVLDAFNLRQVQL